MDFDSFVLLAATADLAEEPAARTAADAIEFRMDLADDPLDTLSTYDGELPILATNRAPWEGGGWSGSDEERLAVLDAAVGYGVAAIDVELASIRDGDADDLLEAADEHDVSVVASDHDFQRTPSRESMRRTLEAGCDRADVGKLAVTAQSREDTLSLLSITRALTAEGRRVATMAMGEVGSHTRAVAPIYGSKIGYAPVDPAEATALGQYDLETLSELVATLGAEG